MPLSRLKLNELYRTISDSGVPTAEIRVSQKSETRTLMLQYRDTDHVLKDYSKVPDVVEYFTYTIEHPQSGSSLLINNCLLPDSAIAIINRGKDDYDIQIPNSYFLRAYVPESERFRWTLATDSWNDAKICAKQWADSIAEVITTPNLWEDARAGRTYARYVEGQTDNSLFSIDEQAIIAARLRQIMDSVVKQGQLTSEQVEELNTKLNEMEEASGRLGRKDWLLLFYGGIFTLILGAIVPGDVAQHVFMAVIHDIGYLFTGGPGPRPISS